MWEAMKDVEFWNLITPNVFKSLPKYFLAVIQGTILGKYKVSFIFLSLKWESCRSQP